MEYVNLSPEIKVSKLQFGCARLGKAIKEDTSKIALEVLNTSFKAGINFYDTAANYSYGHSEEILGEFIQDKRDEVYIVTKGGALLSNKAARFQFLRPVFGLLRPIVTRFKSIQAHRSRSNHSFEFLEETLEGSLKRMKIESVDLYLIHNPTRSVLADPEVSTFFEKLKTTGKTQLSGHSLRSIEDLHAISTFENIDAIQFPLNYSVYKEEYYEVLKNIKEKGITLIARAPFERGMLTPYNEVRNGGKFGERNSHLQAKKEALKKKYKCTDIELALWFLKDMDLVDVILFSSFIQEHIQDNITTFLGEIPAEFSWKDLVLEY